MDFDSVAQDNTKTLFNGWNAYGDIESFLEDDGLRMGFFPSCNDGARHLMYSFDINGVLVEVSSLYSLRPGVHRLFLDQHALRVVPMWQLLKKHLTTRNYSQAVLREWSHIHGVKVGLVDGGFQLCISLVPENPVRPSRCLDTMEKGQSLTKQYMCQVLTHFAEQVKGLQPSLLARPTFQRNNLNNLGHMDVCPRDQMFVLSLLDQAISDTTPLQGLRAMVTLSRYGQKDPDPVRLSDMINMTEILKVSVHAGVVIRVNPVGNTGCLTHLMWSRLGLQDVTGPGGAISTNQSIHEAANYQSNLDDHPIVIDDKLLDVFAALPNKPLMNHLQLYCNTPHTHQTPFYKHPVSGVISTCGLLHADQTRAMHARALGYLSHMDDLIHKADIHLSACIEVVLLFEEERGIPELFHPEDAFDQKGLIRLLEKKPMLLPFKDDEGQGLRSVTSAVLQHLSGELHALLFLYSHMGGFKPSWRAFQLELALEEYFHGQPRCVSSRPYSSTLGTSSANIESRTKTRGFLGLAPHSGASAALVPPPLENYIQDQTQRERVERLFLFSDSLIGQPSQVATELVKVLAKDVYRSNSFPLQDLVSEDKPPMVVESVSYECFVHSVTNNVGRFKFPLVLHRANSMLEKEGFDFATLLLDGLRALDIKWFPKIEYFPERSKRVIWDTKSYVELFDKPLDRRMPPILTTTNAVIQHIVNTGLSFGSSMNRYRERGMPWLTEVLARVQRRFREPQRRRDEIKQLNLLCFVSCIGLIQNETHVDLGILRDMYLTIPYTLGMLRELGILSNFTLPYNIDGLQLYRLGPGIPYRVPPLPFRLAPLYDPLTRGKEDSEPEDVQLLEEEEDVPESSTAMVRPAYPSKPWSPEEIAMITLEGQGDMAYAHYVQHCQIAGVPARCLTAFTRERLALQE